MKSRQDYHGQGMTAIFEQYGAFFAFGKDQYDNHAKVGVEYIHLGSGLHVPKNHAKAVGDALAENARKAVQQDIDENGIDAIIRHELANHEYGYTWDITDTLSALEPYGVTAKQVKAIADAMDWSHY
ncbi:MAG: hypothetical protein PHE17_14910 [Thiothrix sp.]|uniref:DUF7659 family protein n=1 Tax=Thiothrix sp. TaxID=1032 RepID=UPI00262F1129|nr:hypothetical protein [Thiothrix sp.]MDD5394302.1 hypothetical protein [Thiothrix sp.]